MSNGQVAVCHGPSCRGAGAAAVLEMLRESLMRRGAGPLDVVPSGCRSLCDMGVVAAVFPGPRTYVNLRPHNLDRLVEAFRRAPARRRSGGVPVRGVPRVRTSLLRGWR